METMEKCPSGLARVRRGKIYRKAIAARISMNVCILLELGHVSAFEIHWIIEISWIAGYKRYRCRHEKFFCLPNHWNRKKFRLQTAHRPRNFGWIVEHGPINPNFNGTCRDGVEKKIAENTNCMTSEYALLFCFGIFCFAVISKCSRSTHDTHTPYTHLQISIHITCVAVCSGLISLETICWCDVGNGTTTFAAAGTFPHMFYSPHIIVQGLLLSIAIVRVWEE